MSIITKGLGSACYVTQGYGCAAPDPTGVFKEVIRFVVLIKRKVFCRLRN